MVAKKIDPVIQLLGIIESGEYAEQTRLPPERDLCTRLGVSRSTLRKALSQLESENKIWRHIGKGTFVGPKPAPDDKIVLSGVTNTTNPSEIMEARLVLEPRLAAIAALRATQNDLNRIKDCLKSCEESYDFPTFECWDEAFHLSIAESAHNSLLLSLFRTVNSLRHDQIWGRLKKAAMNNKRLQIYKRHHLDITRSIENRHSSDAEKSARVHLEVVQKNLLGSL